MGKLINRIPGSCLLVSSLPGSALRTYIESLGKPRDVNLAFPRPCLVNLITKDTHLVFSIYGICANDMLAYPAGREVYSLVLAFIYSRS